MENNRIYIEDFVEDLNYRKIILYIGDVGYDALLKKLKRDNMNKCYRLEYATTKEDASLRNYIYVENCDLQDLCCPVTEYISDEGYTVYSLRIDSGKYYVETGF